LTPKLVSPVADRKVRSVKATQLADHLNVCHPKHLRLQVKCLKARRPSSTELRQVVRGLTIITRDGRKNPSVHLYVLTSRDAWHPSMERGLDIWRLPWK
jgi:hypothetical protein